MVISESVAAAMSTWTLASENFLLPNGTFIAELLMFLLILYVFWRYILPPLSRSLQEREQRTRWTIQAYQEARRMLADAEERYARALNEARIEAARIRGTARAEGERIRDTLRARATTEVEQLRRRGEERLTAQRERVGGELRGELGGWAVQLAGKLLGRSLSERTRSPSVIARYVAQLDGASAEARRHRAGTARSSGGYGHRRD